MLEEIICATAKACFLIPGKSNAASQAQLIQIAIEKAIHVHHHLKNPVFRFTHFAHKLLQKNVASKIQVKWN